MSSLNLSVSPKYNIFVFVGSPKLHLKKNVFSNLLSVVSSHAESSAFIYLIYVISACKVSDTAAKLKIHITSWDYLFCDAGRSLDSHGNSISGKTRCC